MPINIHGKSYNTVAERITSAGKELLSVETEVLFSDPVVIKATITTSKGTFTGISAANPSKQLEKESPWEVAETSAVGRALAFAGYETTNGIASAEEMQKFVAKTSPTPVKTTELVREPTVTPDNCDHDWEALPILTVQKEGPNKNRRFKSCPKCNSFKWVETIK